MRGVSANYRGQPAQVHMAVLVLIAGLAGVLYLALIGWESGDAQYWFVPWLNHIISHGAERSLSEPMQVQVEGTSGFANYNPPYLYLLIVASLAKDLLTPLVLVKLVSIAGTMMCAACVYHLLRIFLRARHALLGAAGFLLLPTVALNGPAWGQTEAIWAGLAVLAVASALRHEWAAMMIAFGAAIAFKLQAIFIAPFILYIALSHRIPIRLLFLPLVAYAAMMIPAWLAGRPAWQLATVYLEQAGAYRWLSMNAPNPWAFIQYLHLLSYETGVVIGLALATLAALALGTLSLRWRLGGSDLLLLAVVVAISMPYLLPKMHDRYFFLADVLAYALAVSRPRWWTIAVAVAIQLGSLGAYASHLFGLSIGEYVGALFIGAALFIAVWQLARILRLNLSSPYGGGLNAAGA